MILHFYNTGATAERWQTKMKDLIEKLRERNDDLCKEAADQLELLQKKYDELGRSYDAMQKDLLKIYDSYREHLKNQ